MSNISENNKLDTRIPDVTPKKKKKRPVGPGMSKPGMTNNPFGRPKGTSIKSIIQQSFIDLMDQKVKYEDHTTNFLDAYMKNFIKSAMEGGWASRMLADRLFSEGILDQIDSQLNKSKREDADFLTYRVYKDCHSIQQQILVDNNKRIYLMAGRRAGKTEADVRKGAHIAIQHEGAQILFVGLTFTRCLELFWNSIQDLFTGMGITIIESKRTEGMMKIYNGSEIHFHGNSTIDERDKLRGAHWDLVVIDEAQSQKALDILVRDIIEPSLMDRNGQLVLSGTGPRARGTYWEQWYNDPIKWPGSRYNFNIADNPFIKNYQKVLDEKRAEHGWTETDPTYIREYLGKVAYDDDAMVFRAKPENIYTRDQLAQWLDTQPIDDIRFTAGLDYGYADCDAFVIICYSKSSSERWIVYEYKKNRTGVSDLVDAIKTGMHYVKTDPLFARTLYVPGVMNELYPGTDEIKTINNKFYIYCDTNEQKITQELTSVYKIPATNAYKYDKKFAIEQLQEDIRTGRMRFPGTVVDGRIESTSEFYKETLLTLWKRNDRDELTRQIDDETYHPDMMDAILYSMRSLWKIQ